jgi:hypothetical protein
MLVLIILEYPEFVKTGQVSDMCMGAYYEGFTEHRFSSCGARYSLVT